MSKLTGRRVVYADPYRADMLGVGSILGLGHCKKLWRRPLYKHVSPLLVWGSGTLDSSVKLRARLFLRFLAVRGFCTRNLLDLGDDIPLGDPGLLAPMLLDRRPRPKYSLGVIPHWEEKDNPEILEFVQRYRHSKIIDPTNPDVVGVTRLIASCETILSSSLHGLAVADAFGIPNARFRCTRTRATNDWKYLDYFSGVARRPLPVIDSLERFKDLHKFLDCANCTIISDKTSILTRLLRNSI